jgi:hypothetical protein
MGYHNCRERLGIPGNRSLPLVVKDQGTGKQCEAKRTIDGLITCTAAGADKLAPPYFIRYADVVPALLKVTGGKHIHLGRLDLMTRLRLRYNLHKVGLPPHALIVVPYVPSVWRALHQYNVDLYVASFPYGGARTLVEAMGAGVAIAPHIHCSSRLLSTFDIAYEGSLFWRTPQELYNHVRQLDPRTLHSLKRQSRRQYEKFHDESLLKNALCTWTRPLDPPPLIQGYMPDMLQKALEVSNEVSCIGSARRALCRMARRLKSLCMASSLTDKFAEFRVSRTGEVSGARVEK